MFRARLSAGLFADPEFRLELDVAFANLYFAARCAHDPAAVPLAWQPLFGDGRAGIAPIQFAIAGMNAHINHDLPVAVTGTCAALATSTVHGHASTRLPEGGPAPRRGGAVRAGILLNPHPSDAVDRHLQAVGNLVASWSINSARDLAWTNSLLLWEVRNDPAARGLLERQPGRHHRSGQPHAARRL